MAAVILGTVILLLNIILYFTCGYLWFQKFYAPLTQEKAPLTT